MTNKKILLAVYFSLRYSARLSFALKWLFSHGYKVDVITLDASNKEFLGVNRTFVVETWEEARFSESSQRSNRLLRVGENLIHKVLNKAVDKGVLTAPQSELEQFLESHSHEYDLIWALNLQSLRSLVRGTRGKHVPIVYETIDLVGEYPYNVQLQSKRKKWEATYINQVDGLVTAGDEYAKYYKQRFGIDALVIHNSAPLQVMPVEQSAALKFLFFGNIAFDRPIDFLIEAFASVPAPHTLTIMGLNLLGEKCPNKIQELGLNDRVSIVAPVPPEEGSKVASQFDVGIAMLDDANLNEHLAPTAKLGTYLGAGLVIAATDTPGMVSEIGSAKAFFAQPRDLASWRHAFSQICQLSSEELILYRQSAHKRAQELLLEKELAKYGELFERLITRELV